MQNVLAASHMVPEELYDLDQDPYEIHNLVTSPKHQKVLERLRSVLNKWIEECDDQGRFPEPPEVVARKGMTKPDAVPASKGKGNKKSQDR